jgi:glutamine cyclotransferase
LNEIGRITVTARLSPDSQPFPVENLNELEWDERIGNQPRVLANVWQTDRILAIDPGTGHVITQYDMSELYINRQPGSDVLNGIAISPNNELWITGKRWPDMYMVEFNNEEFN